MNQRATFGATVRKGLEAAIGNFFSVGEHGLAGAVQHILTEQAGMLRSQKWIATIERSGALNVAVKFADRSGVVVGRQATEITQDGEEAQKFEADYMAVVGAHDNDREKEKDEEEDVGFTPEF